MSETDRPGYQLPKIARYALWVLILFLVLMFFGFLFGRSILFPYAYRALTQKIEDDFGINIHLARALAAVAVIPLAYALRQTLSLKGKNQNSGWVLLFVLAAVYSGGLYAYTKDSNWDWKTKSALRWYAMTPEGIRFYDHDGVDPKYGLPLKPTTLSVQVADDWMHGHRVNPYTSKPYLFLGKGPNGEAHLYETPFQPESGEMLELADQATIPKIRRDDEQREIARQVSENLDHGKQYTDQGDYRQAIESLQKVLDLQPTNRTALAHMKKAEALRQETVDALMSDARKLVDANQLGPAEAELEKVLVIKPDEIKATASLQEIHQRAGREGEQRARNDQILQLIRGADEYHQRGDYTNALASLNQALSLDADSSNIMQQIQSITDELSTRQKRAHVETLLAQSRVYTESGNFASAEGKAKDALLIDPDSQQSRVLVAEAETAMEERKQPFFGVDLSDYKLMHPRPPGSSVGGGQSQPKGVLVVGLRSDIPAAAAGLKRGDVILKLNSVDTPDVAHLHDRLFQMGNEKSFNLLIWRSGQTFNLKFSV